MLFGYSIWFVILSVGLVSIMCFFLGIAMNGVLEKDGFGSYGNMAIMCLGFFLAQYVAKQQHYPVPTIRDVLIVGLAGSCITLAVLVVCKLVFSRI